MSSSRTVCLFIVLSNRARSLEAKPVWCCTQKWSLWPYYQWSGRYFFFWPRKKRKQHSACFSLSSLSLSTRWISLKRIQWKWLQLQQGVKEEGWSHFLGGPSLTVQVYLSVPPFSASSLHPENTWRELINRGKNHRTTLGPNITRMHFTEVFQCYHRLFIDVFWL